MKRGFLYSTIFLLFYTLSALGVSQYLTNTHFAYALDDPYIHMSIVKNLVDKGMWSVDGYHYASASSSPLWVIFLSPFYIAFGDYFQYIPFVINIFFQILSLYMISKIISEYTGKYLDPILFIFLILATPFIALTLGGMEHSLQIFLILLFIYYFLKYFKNQEEIKTKIVLLAIAPIVVFVRYEDAALLTMAALTIALFLKRWGFALFLLLSAFSLVSIFGIWSKFYLGLGIIPSSIMAKSSVEWAAKNFISNFYQVHIIALYTVNLLILFHAYIKKNRYLMILTVLFIPTLIAHSLFGQLGWLFRYEAYLMIFGLLNLYLYLYSFAEKIVHKRLYLYILIPLLPIFYKQIFIAPIDSVYGVKNIYEQQIQMSDFLNKYCNECNIAANDIGAITYFTDIHLLDLAGLGSYVVVEYRKKGQFNSATVNKLLKDSNTTMVIIYDKRFKDIKFDDFEKVATLKIRDNHVCDDSSVSFYSRRDLLHENRLKLEYFSKDIPKSVEFEIYGG